MRSFVKMLSARDMAFSGAMVSLALTRPGTAALAIFVFLGHLSAWQGREMLSSGWDPRQVLPSSGLVYLALLVLSVLVHEAGHLAAAAYRGDLSAGMYLGLRSWVPIFMTSGGTRHTLSGSGLRERPALDLAGVVSQVLFASCLGFLFLLTGSSILPPSVLLIDGAAFASLLPFRGTDGYRFLLRSRIKAVRLEKEAKVGFYKNGRPYKILGLGLFIFYSAFSLALLAFVLGQWLRGAPGIGDGDGIRAGGGIETPVWMLLQDCGVLKTAEYAVLLLPVLQYAYWAIRGLPLTIASLRHL